MVRTLCSGIIIIAGLASSRPVHAQGSAVANIFGPIANMLSPGGQGQLMGAGGAPQCDPNFANTQQIMVKVGLSGGGNPMLQAAGALGADPRLNWRPHDQFPNCRMPPRKPALMGGACQIPLEALKFSEKQAPPLPLIKQAMGEAAFFAECSAQVASKLEDALRPERSRFEPLFGLSCLAQEQRNLEALLQNQINSINDLKTQMEASLQAFEARMKAVPNGLLTRLGDANAILTGNAGGDTRRQEALQQFRRRLQQTAGCQQALPSALLSNQRVGLNTVADQLEAQSLKAQSMDAAQIKRQVRGVLTSMKNYNTADIINGRNRGDLDLILKEAGRVRGPLKKHINEFIQSEFARSSNNAHKFFDPNFGNGVRGDQIKRCMFSDEFGINPSTSTLARLFQRGAGSQTTGNLTPFQQQLRQLIDQHVDTENFVNAVARLDQSANPDKRIVMVLNKPFRGRAANYQWTPAELFGRLAQDCQRISREANQYFSDNLEDYINVQFERNNNRQIEVGDCQGNPFEVASEDFNLGKATQCQQEINRCQSRVLNEQKKIRQEQKDLAQGMDQNMREFLASQQRLLNGLWGEMRQMSQALQARFKNDSQVALELPQDVNNLIAGFLTPQNNPRYGVDLLAGGDITPLKSIIPKLTGAQNALKAQQRKLSQAVAASREDYARGWQQAIQVHQARAQQCRAQLAQASQALKITNQGNQQRYAQAQQVVNGICQNPIVAAPGCSDTLGDLTGSLTQSLAVLNQQGAFPQGQQIAQQVSEMALYCAQVNAATEAKDRAEEPTFSQTFCEREARGLSLDQKKKLLKERVLAKASDIAAVLNEDGDLSYDQDDIENIIEGKSTLPPGAYRTHAGRALLAIRNIDSKDQICEGITAQLSRSEKEERCEASVEEPNRDDVIDEHEELIRMRARLNANDDDSKILQAEFDDLLASKIKSEKRKAIKACVEKLDEGETDEDLDDLGAHWAMVDLEAGTLGLQRTGEKVYEACVGIFDGDQDMMGLEGINAWEIGSGRFNELR